MTNQEYLKALNAYPLHDVTIQAICARRALVVDEEAEPKGKATRLAEADVYAWLAKAPNIKQGDVSYSFSAEERKYLLSSAQQIYNIEDATDTNSEAYGYVGEML
jgi:hypothetical protein